VTLGGLIAAVFGFGAPVLGSTVALVAAAFLLLHDRARHGRIYALAPLVVLTPLAALVAYGGRSNPAWAAFAAVVVAALLARAREDSFASECALKLVWVLGGSLALSWAGLQLMVLATGTSRVSEQWAVLALGLDPPQLWSASLSLSLVAGIVLLGAAPFHFWAADLFQGARAWLAPIAVAALQVSGSGWIMGRLAGISEYPDAARLTSYLLGIAGATAFGVGAVAVLWQKRPERRVGTLASLQGALLLATLAAERAGRYHRLSADDMIGLWAPHLVLALTGAGTFARFLPVSGTGAEPAAVMFRRHPLSAAFGLFALASLAGVPGTPGARLWLEVARGLAGSERMGLMLALAGAWLASFAVAVRQAREAIGVPSQGPRPEQSVPWSARAALWSAGAGLLALGWAWR
jgi:NADH-quinone oxidoreductase subunit N